MLSYGGYNTAIELKTAAYSSWLKTYGMSGCGFDQWNWWGDSTSISGIPNTNAACGSGHTVSTWQIIKICPAGYYPDNASAPTYCTLPDDSVDPSKENGNPDDNLSCSPPPSKTTGNPINFSTGNKFQEELDYTDNRSFSLRFIRTYNSQDGLWRHNYSAHLRISPGNIILVGSDGRESYFSLSGDIANSEPDELGRLSQESGQWIYTSPRREKFSFDSEGRLTRWARSAEEFQTLTYGNDLAVSVTDNHGNILNFTVNTAAQNQPLKLTVGAVKISYSYDSNKHLSKRSIARSGLTETRSYHYEDSRDFKRLTGITDERGVRFATWAYDPKGRAISSSHAADAELTKVSYNADGSSTVTNPLNKITTYQFQVIQGVNRITAINGEPSANCPNSNSTFTYDARGLLKTKTDNKGFITSYDYNERGLEISRTEATGAPQARTTTTTWHTTLNLPLTVTEPGRVTTYTYDSQGRQLSQTSTSTAL